MFLRGRNEWLYDVDVALAAVGLELNLEAVVAEPDDRGVREFHPEVGTDSLRKLGMGISAENDDFAHRGPDYGLLGWSARASLLGHQMALPMS